MRKIRKEIIICYTGGSVYFLFLCWAELHHSEWFISEDVSLLFGLPAVIWMGYWLYKARKKLKYL